MMIILLLVNCAYVLPFYSYNELLTILSHVSRASAQLL